MRIFAWLVLVLGVSVVLVGRAQQTGGAAPKQGTPEYDATYFTGKTEALDGANVTTGRRVFHAGSRSNWHSHPTGQLIFNESGRGLHQIEGQPIAQLGPKESAWVGPNVRHWHGAAADADFTQLNINYAGATAWAERVSDAVYEGKAK
jgi:4-carboxymuconolactone decarboxylase